MTERALYDARGVAERRARLALRVLQLLGAGACVRAGATWWAWGDALALHLPVLFPVVLAGLVLSALVLAQGLAREPRSPRAGVAAFLTAVLLGNLVYLALFPAYHAPYAEATLGLSAGVGSLVALASFGRLRSRILVLVATLAGSLLAAELGLRVYARVVPTYILASSTSGARYLLAARRLVPGKIRHGYQVNSRGDYDDEPRALAPGERRVVVIGDSFSVGTVPLPLNFTSRIEDELPGVDVYNLGAPGIGPPEYLHLLLTEALALQPDLVVVDLYVGNDLVFASPERPWRGWLHPLYGRDAILLLRLFVRTLRIEAESRDARGMAEPAWREDLRQLDLEQLLAAHPWTLDPTLETPTYSEARFHANELAKAETVCDRGSSEELAAFPFLERMVEAAGDVPLVFVVIPEEFQVEDGLWGRLAADSQVDLERDRPQRLLSRWFAERGIDFLDLLPASRAEEPLLDGDRHLYHQRNTHWNVRGNELAGREMAAFLRARLPAQPPSAADTSGRPSSDKAE